ncbi:MAG: ribosome small subunit-dependent GTPase A [Sphaerochaetaceae bacterium]|nr:ribosome small subunit-dependent GTPase A [Sphaerochaetaceae bacterium]
MTGTVYRSINNIYTVKNEAGEIYLCRIKGKHLKDAEGEYNPIVVGDLVDFVPTSSTEGLVISRLERKGYFARWNAKKEMNQVICANMDALICVTSAMTPPFRPRFVDRVIACSRNVDITICMNKSDILLTEDEFERFSLYKKLGFNIISVSAKTGENIDGLKSLLLGKRTAFVGQSGVGKSSLVNRLLNVDQRVGELSEKYNRGCHTTNHALLFEGEGFSIIDTPGFREISVPHDDPHLVAKAFPEFDSLSAGCTYDSCLHVDEPGCKVREAAENGLINDDRYESYLRILESLEDRSPLWSRNVQKNSK